MTFIILESGAFMLAILMAMEMRRQRMSWQSVLLCAAIVLGTATAMIVMWRGL